MSESPDDPVLTAPQDDVPPPLGTDFTSEELEDVLARRRPLHRRAVQLVLSLAALLLALGMVLQNALPLLRLRTGGSASATPPAVVALVESNVSYGTVTVNGRKYGPPPVMVTLRHGDNQITLAAPPFLAHSCHVLINASPQGSFNTCDLVDESGALGSTWQGGVVASTTQGGGPGSTTQNVVNLSLTADDLPPDLRASALVAVAQALAAVPLPAAIVPAGQYYAIGIDPQGTILSQRATAPLTATLALAPYDTASTALPATRNTASFQCGGLRCAPPFLQERSATGHIWTIGEAVALTWRFTTPSGTKVGAVAIPVVGAISLDLSYDAHAGWRVVGALTARGMVPPSLRDICGVGATVLQQDLGPNNLTNHGIGWSNPADYGVGGCILQLQNQNGTSQALFVWRFGVLLAADTQAHAILPALPMAPPDEIAAVTG